MFLIFKPQLGAGLDSGGIATGYVIPTDRKPKASPKKRPVKRKARLATPLTPTVIVDAVENRRTDELKERLSALSLDFEIELLQQAATELDKRIQATAQEALTVAQHQYAQEMLSFMLEEAERELATERAEVLEILDILDDGGLRAVEVYSFSVSKKI